MLLSNNYTLLLNSQRYVHYVQKLIMKNTRERPRENKIKEANETE